MACACLTAVAAQGQGQYQCHWETASGGLRLDAAAWAGTRFVGVGRDADGVFVAVSATGVDWTVTAHYGEPADDRQPGVLAWNGHELLGVIGSKAWTSLDGLTWTAVANGFSPLGRLFPTGAGDRFFAWVYSFGWGGNYLVSSTDGADWSPSYPLPEVRAVVYTGSQYVAVGNVGPWVFTSPDATTWTEQPLPAWFGRYVYFNAVAWDGQELVAVGNGGRIVTSPDGAKWTSRESGVAVTLWSVVVTPDGFVCGGDNGTLLRSHDGVTWQPEATPARLDFFGLVGGGPRTLAIDGDFGVFVRSCEEDRPIRRHLTRPPG